MVARFDVNLAQDAMVFPTKEEKSDVFLHGEILENPEYFMSQILS